MRYADAAAAMLGLDEPLEIALDIARGERVIAFAYACPAFAPRAPAAATAPAFPECAAEDAVGDAYM